MIATDKAVVLLNEHDKLFVKSTELSPWYYTFGSGQAFPGFCIRIWADNSGNARIKMTELFGHKWSMEYDEAEIIRYDNDYGITLLAEYVADM